MDASDEFKFVVVSGRTRNNGHHKEGCRDPLPRSGSVENLRSVPVRIYNTSKNLKLEFLWNRAFKLFQHRTVKVYQAVSGINYQESYGERSCSHSGTSRSTGISLRAKSLSHSHLSISGLENIMEQPGTSRGNCSSGGGKGGSNRKILVEGSSSGNNDDDDNKIKTAYEQHQPVAMPRKRTVSKLASISSSSGSRNNATTTVNANPTTSSNKQQRPVSISGGEKPQGDEGRMDDNCISMGNNIRIPPPFLPAHLRRSQSARSRCSVDSLLSCHNHNDNGEISSTHVLSSNSSQFHSRVHKKLAKSNTQPTPVAAAASPIYNNSWSISSSPCPDFGSTGAFERGNCSDDCSSEIVSNLDSGLDTWKATTRSPSPCSSGMKPKLRDSSGIVCTISQRIPTSDAKSEGALQPEATSQISTRYDDSLENCRKMMNYNNNCSGTGNTTVVLINGCFESDLCQNVAQYDSLNLSDYDYECMSEVDLNSEPGSTGSGVVAAAFVGGVSSGVVCDKEKLTRVCNLSCENNELDSLDLTLFEEARRAGPVASFCATIMTDTTFRQDNDEPLYDTVCSEEHGDSLSGVRNYTPNESGGSNNINSWSDAGSEFEFMSTNAASNREIVMGHVPRGNPPEVDWEPYYCVLNQLDQIFTGYRSEDFYKLTDNGISSTEVPRMRLDGGPNSIKCLIGNAAKWGMNTLLEEEEESGMLNGSTNDKSKNADSSSGSIHRNSSPPLGKFMQLLQA